MMMIMKMIVTVQNIYVLQIYIKYNIIYTFFTYTKYVYIHIVHNCIFYMTTSGDNDDNIINEKTTTYF